MNHTGTTQLHTERLTLRRFALDDAQAMFDNWASDAEVTRFLTWPAHASVEVTASVLGDWIAQYAQPDFYQWAICLRETGEPVGSISVVSCQDEVSALEIGYCIGRRWWRQGITSEALQAVIDHLFAEVGALRVCAKHDPHNPNSGKVMQHCGMTYEGTLRQAARNSQGICDVCVYSVLRGEWGAQGK
jgi:ribosomal-protein-alanine N-acetyltransferase